MIYIDTTNPTQPAAQVCDTCVNCDIADRCKVCGGCKKVKTLTDAEKMAGGCICNPCTCPPEIPAAPAA